MHCPTTACIEILRGLVGIVYKSDNFYSSKCVF